MKKMKRPNLDNKCEVWGVRECVCVFSQTVSRRFRWEYVPMFLVGGCSSVTNWRWLLCAVLTQVIDRPKRGNDQVNIF